MSTPYNTAIGLLSKNNLTATGERAANIPGRPASQLEVQISNLTDDAERINRVVEELEQRLRLVLRDMEPSAVPAVSASRESLVNHAETLLNIRESLQASESRVLSILGRLEV